MDLSWVPDEWRDPRTAAQADAASVMTLLQMLVAARFRLQDRLDREENFSARRRIERDLDDSYKTSTILMNLNKTGV